MDRARSVFSSSDDDEGVCKEDYEHTDPYRTPPRRTLRKTMKNALEAERPCGIRFQPFGSPESPYEIAISGLKPKVWGRSPHQLRHLSTSRESLKVETPVKCLTYESPVNDIQDNTPVVRSNTIAAIASKLIAENEDLNIDHTLPLEECTNLNHCETRRKKRKRFSDTCDLDNAHILLAKATKRLKISDEKPNLERCITLGVCRKLFPGLATPDFSSFNENNSEEELSDESRVTGDLVHICHFPVIKSYRSKVCTIRSSVLANAIINQKSVEHSKYRTIVVDCRFPYEYNGGHIIGAYNLYTEESVYKFFFDNVKKFFFDEQGRAPLLVFHCEFSSKRGPKLASYVRDTDRYFHKECYPKLFYPEVYLLKGGYREFFLKYQSLCEPEGYIEMFDKNFTEERFHFLKITDEEKYSNAAKNEDDLDDALRRIF